MLRWIFIAIVVTFLPGHAVGQEGHELWWWACQRADFVVKGELTYDSSKYYEIKPVGVDKKSGTYHLLVGTLSISEVLYVNKTSQNLESYQQYSTHVGQKYPVLISAHLNSLPPGKPVFSPLLYDIPKGPSIFALSQVYVFPFTELKLEDGVPVEHVDEAMKVITARPNNLLSLSGPR